MLNQDDGTWEAVPLGDGDIVTVCAECLRACCWQGEFMCDGARDADITTKTVGQLRELNARPDFDGETEEYWQRDQEMKR